MTKLVSILLVIACVSHAQLWAKDMQCIALDDVPNTKGIPLTSERIVRVPEQEQRRAFLLLGTDALQPLSQSQVQELLVGNPLNTDVFLERQTEEAEDKAKDCRDLASDPFFAEQKARLLRGASAYQQYAAYTRELPRELHPYLIKAKVLSEADGGFSAFLKDDSLRVEHNSLGYGPAEPKDIAVVVFVERPINRIDAFFSGAE